MKSKLIRDDITPPPGAGVALLACGDKRIQIALLVGKLHEEAQEIAEDITNAEEYADLLTVMLDLMRLGGVDYGRVLAEVERKRGERGGFGKGHVYHRASRRRVAA